MDNNRYLKFCNLLFTLLTRIFLLGFMFFLLLFMSEQKNIGQDIVSSKVDKLSTIWGTRCYSIYTKGKGNDKEKIGFIEIQLKDGKYKGEGVILANVSLAIELGDGRKENAVTTNKYNIDITSRKNEYLSPIFVSFEHINQYNQREESRHFEIDLSEENEILVKKDNSSKVIPYVLPKNLTSNLMIFPFLTLLNIKDKFKTVFSYFDIYQLKAYKNCKIEYNGEETIEINGQEKKTYKVTLSKPGSSDNEYYWLQKEDLLPVKIESSKVILILEDNCKMELSGIETIAKTEKGQEKNTTETSQSSLGQDTGSQIGQKEPSPETTQPTSKLSEPTKEIVTVPDLQERIDKLIQNWGTRCYSGYIMNKDGETKKVGALKIELKPGKYRGKDVVVIDTYQVFKYTEDEKIIYYAKLICSRTQYLKPMYAVIRRSWYQKNKTTNEFFDLEFKGGTVTVITENKKPYVFHQQLPDNIITTFNFYPVLSLLPADTHGLKIVFSYLDLHYNLKLYKDMSSFTYMGKEKISVGGKMIEAHKFLYEGEDTEPENDYLDPQTCIFIKDTGGRAKGCVEGDKILELSESCEEAITGITDKISDLEKNKPSNIGLVPPMFPNPLRVNPPLAQCLGISVLPPPPTATPSSNDKQPPAQCGLDQNCDGAVNPSLQLLVNLYNAYRGKLGLPEIKINKKLVIAACKHANWMVKNNKFTYGEDIKGCETMADICKQEGLDTCEAAMARSCGEHDYTFLTAVIKEAPNYIKDLIERQDVKEFGCYYAVSWCKTPPEILFSNVQEDPSWVHDGKWWVCLFK